MKKNRILTTVLLLVSFCTIAQDGLVKQYQFNQLSYNPAYAGENGIFSVKTLLGQQFNGTLRPNQVNQMLVIDGQLYNQGGIAFQAFRSNIGNVLSRGFLTSYSKGFELGEVSVKAGIDAGLMINNQIVLSANSQIAPFVGAGGLVMYKGLFAGISKPMAVASKKIVDSKPVYFQLGYIHSPENSLFHFNINALLYNFSNQNNIDLNTKFWYNQRVGLGLSLRKNNIYRNFEKTWSLIPSVEYKMYKSVHVGISYDNNKLTDPLSGGSSYENDLNLRGIFQLYFRYTSNPNQGDSKFFNKF